MPLNDDERLLYARLKELAERSDGRFTFTDFLGLAEQSVLTEVLREIRVRYELFGGADGAEGHELGMAGTAAAPAFAGEQKNGGDERAGVP